MNDQLMQIAATLQSGVRDEADATEKYFSDIADIETRAEDAGLSSDDLAEIERVYEEIIREELRHQEQFRELFSRFIGIPPIEH